MSDLRVAEAVVRRRFLVRGLVQGVGFRPFVHATAGRLALTGSVRNDSSCSALSSVTRGLA